MGKRKTTKEFINEAEKVHGEKYNYREVNYHTIDKHVIIYYY